MDCCRASNVILLPRGMAGGPPTRPLKVRARPLQWGRLSTTTFTGANQRLTHRERSSRRLVVFSSLRIPCRSASPPRPRVLLTKPRTAVVCLARLFLTIPHLTLLFPEGQAL